MSFFGPNNTNNNLQQQQPTGFGPFGTASNTGSGFGQPQNTGFGAATNNSGGGSMFGGGNTGFGSGATGFGAPSSTTAFGNNRPAFGSNPTSSSSMFGSTTATAGGSGGFGGFGGANTNNNAGSLFGGNNKPAFGAGNAGGGSLFGGGTGTPVFGTNAGQSTSAFGAPLSSALNSNTAESQGTGSTPFQAHTEKESGSTVTNHFQSISFMQPYKNFSFEELRLADYNQGRRFGNGSGQAGAFGTSTNFGGFGQQSNPGPFGGSGGNTGGGLFGNPPTSAASPFGTTQTTGSGFGGGGGLFGAKPAATSLFSTTNTTAAQPTGGLFSTANQAGFGAASGGTGFGGGTGGLFGTGGQQTQPAKGAFAFGTAGTTSGFGTAAGGTNTTGSTSLFGVGQPASGFGGGQQQQQQQQQQAGASNPFAQTQGQTGAGSGFGGFGTNQQAQKPGGLFGVTPSSSGGTGTSIFGGLQSNNAQQPQTGSIFGTNSNNQTGSSSLFGPKPATLGGGLFNTNPTNPTNTGGGGLFSTSGFGNNNNNTTNQQNQGVGPFGGSNQQQQQQPKSGGLFSSVNSTAGGGLFNLSNNNNSNPQQQASGSSLFGNLGSSGQPSLFSNPNNNGSSLFPNTIQQPNALQPPQPQIATALDPLPYGSVSIFTGLPPPPQMNAGPIATPISTGQRMRKSAVLPQYKINPIQASRLVTPQKHGFGFSYSTYGTPSSISSNASTPGGLSSSLLYGSIGRGLGKSLSTSNLRRSFDSDGESILSPGAFSAGSSRFSGSGSLKKLTIDRSLRTDLFGSQGIAPASNSEKVDQARQPGILKKKVSFDASAVGGDGSGQTNNESEATNDSATRDGHNHATPSAQEQGYLRSSSRGGLRILGPKSNGGPSDAEMESVKGNELAIVHEDESSETAALGTHRSVPQIPQADPQPGRYWMRPSKTELSKLSKEELKRVEGFSVGREGCGHVEFDEPVDLTLASLDDIYEKLALIELRSLTVYPDSTKKPPVGQGMNVPSTIFLENSWPRQKDRKTPSHEKSGPRFNKHVDRLRKVTGTEFVRYEKDTGTWVFKVPHFTTYSLDYDDTLSEGDSLETSNLSALSDAPTPKARGSLIEYTQMVNTSALSSSVLSDERSPASSSPDDTFEFKKKNVLPGAFNQTTAFENDDEVDDTEHTEESLSSEDTGRSASDSGADEPSEIQNDEVEVDERALVIRGAEMEMAGSFPHLALEDSALNSNGNLPGHNSILKVDEQGQLRYGTPTKLNFNPSGNWAEELQRTVSPRKQDRQALRQMQETKRGVHEDEDEHTPKMTDKRGGSETTLVTSIDLMNSLFGKQEARRSGGGNEKGVGAKGFKWPYSKKSRSDNEDHMSETDQNFHTSYKPHWGPQNTLVYAMSTKFSISGSNLNERKSLLYHRKGTFATEGKDIRFAKFTAPTPLVPRQLAKQRASTRFSIDQGVPFAATKFTTFQELASSISDNTNDEVSVWELAAILFDEPVSQATSNDHRGEFLGGDHRARKDRLIQMWKKICKPSAMKDVSSAPNAEEKAMAQLSANNVVEACDELMQGKDFRLAILLAQIDGGQSMREDMASQLNEWRGLDVLSEITDPVRALYELLSGNTCFCEGKRGPLENSAKSFVISDRFGLDWRRAFGLRLWYAILPEEPLEAAVKKYAQDLENHESKKPVPVFPDDQTANLWQDKNRPQREDVLWGLLKLYAAAKGETPMPQIAEIIMPHNTSGNPLDCRLSFQLYHALALRFAPTDPSTGDRLARDLAAQLDSGGEWIYAIFILLHLSDHRERQQVLQMTLAPHAHQIDDADQPLFKILTDEFHIPPSWIWEAKALHARCVTQDRVHEVQFLQRAGNWTEAHHTMCSTVAPRAVIEEDLTTLRQLLDAFRDGKRHVSNWPLGGQVYEDFEKLVSGKSGRERALIVKRLLAALPRMAPKQAGRWALEEMVAVKEMSGVVAQAVLGEKGNNLDVETSSVLQLPLAGDVYAAHTMQIATRYYKDLLTVI